MFSRFTLNSIWLACFVCNWCTGDESTLLACESASLASCVVVEVGLGTMNVCAEEDESLTRLLFLWPMLRGIRFDATLDKNCKRDG